MCENEVSFAKVLSLSMGKKMQNVKFADVEEFLDYLPDEEREVVDALRELILETVPNCREKLSYNVPFYHRFKSMAFIWPGSVLWGSKQAYEGVRLGFTRGSLMHDPEGYLDKGTRKQVYTKDFLTLDEIDPDLIRYFLYQAIEIDDMGKGPGK